MRLIRSIEKEPRCGSFSVQAVVKGAKPFAARVYKKILVG
jgi:hypothetical protein